MSDHQRWGAEGLQLMPVCMVLIIATPPPNKLAAKLRKLLTMEMVKRGTSPNRVLVYPITPTQRAQQMVTSEGIFAITTPRSTTRWLQRISGISSLQPRSTSPPTIVVTTPPPDRSHHSLQRHSWTTLSASSLQMIRYGLLILDLFMFLHIFKSIRVVECHEFRQLCMVLRESLEDTDIPHRDKMREVIVSRWRESFEALKLELSVS